MIEKIYNCKVCLSYAKSIAKENYEEIFSLALEKIIVQNPQNVENYQSYFYTVLKNENIGYINKTTDEEYIFYQDLIYLSFENSKLSLCSKLKLRRADLDIYLKQAHKLIKDEYIRIVGN